MSGAPKARAQDVVQSGKMAVIPGFEDSQRKGDEVIFTFQSGLLNTDALSTASGVYDIAPCNLSIIGGVILNIDAADSALLNIGTATDANLFLATHAVASTALAVTTLLASQFLTTSIDKGARIAWNSTSMAGMNVYSTLLCVPRNT